MHSMYILLLLVGHVMCIPERVFVKLANGGTSRPILVQPLYHHHGLPYDGTSKGKHKLPVPEALSQDHENKASEQGDSVHAKGTGEMNSIQENITRNLPKDSLQVNPQIGPKESDSYGKNAAESNSQQDRIDKSNDAFQDKTQDAKTLNVHPSVLSDNGDTNLNENFHLGVIMKDEDNFRLERDTNYDDPDITRSTGIIISTLAPITIKTTSKATSEETKYTTTTSIKPTTTPKEPMSTSYTTRVSPTSPLTNSPPPVLPCHESCLKALNATHLYSNNSLILGQGSDLTLFCELPLDASFYIENLIWLFHPYNSPNGQCSLTTQEFISSCYGFQSVKNTDDRNDTFLRETITLDNIQVNHTGQYMCQVQITCCPDSKEHIMNQERILQVTVQVWTSNYTLDLTVAGSTVICLLLLLIGVNYYLHKCRNDDYVMVEDQIKEMKPTTVLHLPLIEDQDNDSFDSNFDE
ncbi:uncharacterized protein LOC121863859 [Homarus americanus]|uniref:Ig-like domain-containing protein n=1 Tax=Homarus americanus TaxID=6706 RepID=A0A8J5N105_HOMAM|nr:uncharacterized protein LOC121863859 [Homarus americanus]KAG7171004.1 hypothetical protein Hamer_G012580 [Homarus americanus]